MKASKLYDDAFALLQRIIDIEAEYIKAIFVIGEAYSEEDTIYINNYAFPMPRQQEKTDTNEYLSLSDYIAPKSSNKKDYLGAFAVTAGAGTEYLLNKYRSTGDEHSALVLESLFMYWLKALQNGCTKGKKEYWGYASSEELTIPAMFAAKYSGIRATVGSAMLPDSAININLHNMLQADEIYISVDDKGKMTPAASLAGFSLHILQLNSQIG